MTSKLRLVWLACLSILAFWGREASPAIYLSDPYPSSEDGQRVELLDRVGGAITGAIPLSDGTLIMAEGPSLVHLRLADQTSGQTADVLARTDLGHSAILELAEVAPFVYALTEEGLVVLGGNPLGPLDFTPGGGQAIAAYHDLVAVAAGEAGLRLLRVDPSGVVHLLGVLPLSGYALDVAISSDGTTAYVAAGEQGVQIVDLSHPDQPSLRASLSQFAPARSVTVSGALLVVGSEQRVLVLDPTPEAPRLIGVYAPLESAQRLVIQDDYAYIADATGGLKIVWLAAPDRPVQVYGEASSPAHDVWVEGELVYVVGPGGLRILDVSNRFRPLVVGRVELPGTPQGIALAPGRVFVALGEEGVAVIDVSNLTAPRVTRRIPLEGRCSALLLMRDTLYVATGESGLAVIDAARPGHETLLDTVYLPGQAFDLARRGPILYIAAGEAGLLAVDTSFPGRPLLVGALAPQTGRAILSVTIDGKRAYLAEGDSFLVADVSRADSLRRLARLTVPAHDLAVNDVYLYALFDDRLAIFDARATAEPIYLRSYVSLDGIADIKAEDERLFLTNTGEGADLVVLSLLAPDQPVELDNLGETGQTPHVLVHAGEVWLARGYAGLVHYSLSEGGALIPRGEFRGLPGATHLASDGVRLLVGGPGGWALSGGDLTSAWFGPDDVPLPIRDLALAGDRVAIAAGEDGVALYALDANLSPVLVARQQTRGPATGVALADGLVYVADAGGLSIYDGRYLMPVAQLNTPAPANGLAVRNGLAYLPLLDGELAVIDLAQPNGGIVVRSTVPTRRPADLIPTPDGRTVYALADETLIHLNIDDPARVWVIAQGSLPYPAGQGLFVNELFAALSPGESLAFYNLAFLDANVVSLGDIPLSGEALVANGPVGYVAYGQDGLGMFRLREPGQGIIFYPEEVHALYLAGQTLFALGASLTAWDVSRPDAPQQMADLPLFAPGRSIDPGADGRLLLGLENGLSIVAWDGTTLNQVGHLTTTSRVDRAAQLGTRAYLALHGGGLLIADLSDPAEPKLLFSITSESGRFVRDLLPLDDQHLLVSWEGGIDSLDVSAVGTAPRLLSVVPSGGSEALDVALSTDGSRAALALGETGILLLSLDDPAAPRPLGLIATPGNGQRAVPVGNMLLVADGVCGLRVIDVSDPAVPHERGYWRSNFAADLAVMADSSEVDEAGRITFYLADVGQLLKLRYDPAGPAVPPPIPQFHEPADGQDQLPLSITLNWGPPADPCQPLTYAVYLGVADDPPFLGQVGGDPSLEVADLEPLRTYHWRVEAVDRQGDRVRGPLWRFTTAPADFADTLPPAPPLFVARLRQNPVLPVGLVFLVVSAIGGLVWLRLRRKWAEPTIPEWYATELDEDEQTTVD